MLKSTLNAVKPSEPKRPTLPHLFKSLETGAVVYVDDFGHAFTVVSTQDCRPLGFRFYVHDLWDTSHWTPLKPGESVTITVEED